MQRLSRQFVVGAAGAGLLAGCGRLPWQAQEPKMPRIGYLGDRSIPAFEEAFRQGLREHGHVDGKNIAIEWRFADGNPAALADLAVSLVNRPVDLIAAATTPAALAAGQATSTTPIVMTNGDPVGSGLAASLARPGGNVTGLANFSPELGAKRLELLKYAIPSLARVAVLWTPYNPVKVAEWAETQSAARTLGLQLQSLEMSSPDDLEPAFATATRERADALIVFGDNLTSAHAAQIVDLAARGRLPTMYGVRTFMEVGGLMAYGPSLRSLYHRAAYYVDRILKGTQAADLPIEQPMTFEFVVNMTTARGLGITFPHEVALQITEVIE
jgi:putative ABC transport system substrate-binding protein